MADVLPILESPMIGSDPEAGFGALETSLGPLPLKALDVRAHILGLIARVRVSQTFVNTHSEPIEAIYIFPLPPRAAVSNFTMRVGDRLVEGRLFERELAREKYANAIHEGKRAAMAEEDRPNVFTLSVGNLMPGDEAEIAFELSGLLCMEGHEAEWRFPLVVAPRYIPGLPLGAEQAGLGTSQDTDQVPDASRLNPPILLPGYPNPVRLGIEVELEPAGLTLSDIRSSLHSICETQDQGRTLIRLAQKERLDRDFILRFRIQSDEIQALAVCVPDEDGLPSGPEGELGTLMVTIVPPSADPIERRGRDVVFVLDRSGSMEGWKIVAARRAVARMVDTLRPEDRFDVITFSTVLDSLGKNTQGLLPATDRNRFQALEFLAGTHAEGGTEMEGAFRSALRLLSKPEPNRESILFLVTDGQVGNEPGLLKVRTDLGMPCRFQIIGIDEAVNESLLQRLASASGGWFLAAESEDRLDQVLLMASRKFGNPLITGINLQAPGLGLVKKSLASNGSLDLYPGTPLILMGRYKKPPEIVSIKVQGEDKDHGEFLHTMPAHASFAPELRNIWARWKIRDLEDSLAWGDKKSIQREITGISLTHSVLCRYTAFLAVDDSVVANQSGQFATLIQPVEMPREWAGQHAPAFAACFCAESAADSDYEFLCPAVVEPEPITRAVAFAKSLLESIEDVDAIWGKTDGFVGILIMCDWLAEFLEGGVFEGSPSAGILRESLILSAQFPSIPQLGERDYANEAIAKLKTALALFLEEFSLTVSDTQPKGNMNSSTDSDRRFWQA